MTNTIVIDRTLNIIIIIDRIDGNNTNNINSNDNNERIIVRLMYTNTKKIDYTIVIVVAGQIIES